MPDAAAPLTPFALPLFPLHAVLFPDGRLPLQVFEPRYRRLVADCLRTERPFGVVLLRRGSELHRPHPLSAGASPPAEPAEPPPLATAAAPARHLPFVSIGCLAHIEQHDRQDDGLLRIDCRGGARFRILGHRPGHCEPQDRAPAPVQEADGLWQATVRCLPADPPRALPAEPPRPAPPAADEGSGVDLARQLGSGPGTALATVLRRLAAAGQAPIQPPLRLDEAGWVANRWAELLPLPLLRKQGLMAEADPLARLAEVRATLRGQGLIG